ncbi:MAG TPA: aldo/keto reductase [Ktedonobacteraceae bacterium]|nr:aldo/keto reductase [Ktedonobacteraceae bacterium]
MSFDTTNERTASAAGTIQLDVKTVVNRIGFGTMRLPGPGIWGEPTNPTEARAVLRRAVELGANFIDTAVYYGPDVANRLIVETLYPYPANLFIATKVGARRGADKSWRADMQPASLRAACEENLRQLRLEQLHLVHCRHVENSGVPFADSFAALAELQREGKIRHLGVSNVTLAQLREAQAIAPVVSVQNLYNLLHREGEEILEACTQERIVFSPFFPLAMGRLGQSEGPLLEIAQQHHATTAQIALAWLLKRSPMLLVIPGTSSLNHLEENFAAATIQLSDEEFHRLDTLEKQ